jgi:hypothetical protein
MKTVLINATMLLLDVFQEEKARIGNQMTGRLSAGEWRAFSYCQEQRG